jgi:hypothetical protein
LGFPVVEAPDFLDIQHMKVVRLSALCTVRLYPQKGFLVLISVKKPSRPQGHNATGRIKSLKNSSYSIGTRTRDLPICSTVPQPTAPSRTPIIPASLINYDGTQNAAKEMYTRLQIAHSS